MNKITKYIMFSTVVFLLVVGDVSQGYEFGPIIDRIIIYLFQYVSFFKYHANSTEIKYDVENDIPVPNIPRYPIDERNVPFYLYTRKNPDVPEILYAGDSKERLLRTGFDPSRDTVFFAHGFIVTVNPFAYNYTTALLPRKDINLILVVWDSYAFYDSGYTEIVTVFRLGAIIARFVQNLIDVGADPKNMNLIGHSDGAAMLTLAAKQISPRVGRLTAFDPVGNYFNFLPQTVRISTTDADYVQIVHCTIAVEGLPPQVKGDVTFYMNDALVQPQCVNSTDVGDLSFCSHNTCLAYLNESLQKNDTLLGIKCAGFLSNAPKDYDFSNQVILTYDVPTNVRGMYCVHTNSPPTPDIF